ncbi:hypothetical protein SpCBS45565_g06517 [Spizellomyces sp. 'palustris']|nr:hypothetical protein SpCBS45565_g06517 [Spizellomyces sp. 'palustris']
MAAEGRHSQEHSDRLVAAYLKTRGYRHTEAFFRKEANLPLSEGSLDSGLHQRHEASVPDYILFYNEAEASNPNAYERGYSRLRKWVDDSIDKYKVELRGILFPIFVHAYLDLIVRELRDQAKHFMELFRVDHSELHGQDIARLSAILEPHHVSENDLAQNFRANRYGLRMSRYSFELLLSFLQDNNFMLLLRIVNEHISILVVSTEPENGEEGLDKDQTIGLVGQSVHQLEDFNRQQLALGTLPPDIPFLTEVERKIKEEAPPDASELLEELEKVKLEATADSPAITLPAKKLIDVPAAIKSLKETRNRVQLSSTTLPSICCYTFHNSSSSLQSLTLSPDASTVSGGFADSFIRLWDITGADTKTSRSFQLNCGKLQSQASMENKERSHQNDLSDMAAPCTEQVSARIKDICNILLQARLWSLDTFSNVACYKGHNYPVWDVDFSSQGWYFATASHDRTARLWSCDHIYPLRVFVGHLSDVDVVRFHPNCSYLLTGSNDRTARLWDVQKGTCVRIFKGHHGAVQTLAFSPDGRTVASSGEDHNIILWDISSGKRIKTMAGHTGVVHTLCFSKDGAVLASGGGDNTVRIWDAKRAEVRELGVKRDTTHSVAQDRYTSLMLYEVGIFRTQ